VLKTQIRVIRLAQL